MPKDISSSSSSSEDEAASPATKSPEVQKEARKKTTRYQCPADFVTFCHKPCSSTLTESLKNNKNELWLIKAPASFHPDCFRGVQVPLSGLQTLKVRPAGGGDKTSSGHQIFNVLGSSHGASDLHLLTGQDGKSSSGDFVLGPSFSGLLNVSECYGLSGADRPPQAVPAAPAPAVPPGLRQRFYPFGSQTPTLSCEADGGAVKRHIEEEEEEEEGRKKKKKKKKEKKVKTEQEEEEVKVKEEPQTRDEVMMEVDAPEEKRKKKKKKKDREREEEEVEEVEVKVEEVVVKSEPTDSSYGDAAKKKKKKKKKSKTEED